MMSVPTMGPLMSAILVAILCGTVTTFNVDVPSRLVHRSDQANSMFGFSVAMHKDKGVGR